MVVAAAVVELHVEGSRSLKEKRGVVRSISKRLRNRFNVSVAEVGGQGTWQRAALGLSAAGTNETLLRRHLAQAIDFVHELHLAQVIGTDLAVFDTGYTSGDDDEPDADDLPAAWREEDDVPSH